MASLEIPWHDGELKLHSLLAVPSDYDRGNPTQPLLTAGAARRFASSPLIAVGARDALNRPWVTVWGGAPGLAQPLGGSILGITAEVDTKFDPVVQALFGDESGDVKVTGKNMLQRQLLLSGLAIDLEKRLRWKMAGKMIAGAVIEKASEPAEVLKQDPEGQDLETGANELAPRTLAQLIVKVDQSLGNCPKYLNAKRIRPVTPTHPKVVHTASAADLSPEALSLIAETDLFFVASSNANTDMDTNYRGGPHGFVRVRSIPSASCDSHTKNVNASNDGPKWEIIWPEYSGNRLYQTLGNLAITPQAGLVFPNLDTGDVLYVTGDTEILVGKDAAAVITKSNLAVKLTVTGARFVRQGLSFRGDALAPSPYNPRVRLLASEAASLNSLKNGSNSQTTTLTATLLSRTTLTSTISRFRFSLSSSNSQVLPIWAPGAWVAFDFSTELDMGYSHMRDDDPRSLNDDFVRTFTVSSPAPAAETISPTSPREREFEITIRNVGSATNWLFKQNPRASVELPVLGFGGGEDEVLIQPSPGGARSVSEPSTLPSASGAAVTPFIAGGIGITPLLSQLHILNPSRLQVFWSVAAQDLGLVSDTLKRAPEWLGACTSIFVTGFSSAINSNEEGNRSSDEVEKELEYIRGCVAGLELRRLGKQDLIKQNSVWQARRWVVCAGKAFREVVEKWLQEDKGDKDGTDRRRNVVFEDFGF